MTDRDVFEALTKSQFETAKLNGDTPIMVFKIAYPGVAEGEDSSCLEDPKVKFYRDQIYPLSEEYLNDANFNTYLRNKV